MLLPSMFSSWPSFMVVVTPTTTTTTAAAATTTTTTTTTASTSVLLTIVSAVVIVFFLARALIIRIPLRYRELAALDRGSIITTTLQPSAGHHHISDGGPRQQQQQKQKQKQQKQQQKQQKQESTIIATSTSTATNTNTSTNTSTSPAIGRRQRRQRKRILILFDGDCVLCNGFVRFCHARDPAHRLAFGALESPHGKRLLHLHGLFSPQPLPTAPQRQRRKQKQQQQQSPTRVTQMIQSFVVIEAGRAYVRSDAALHALSSLQPSFLWLCLTQMLVEPMPRVLRDAVYDLGWATRRRIWGTTSECARIAKNCRIDNDSVRVAEAELAALL